MGRIFVAGSINMDVVATAKRHPRLGETVFGETVFFSPGGKGANQAVAAAKLGADVALIGRLGADAFGDQLKAYLTEARVDLSLVRQTTDANTGTAIITVADGDNSIVVIPGANALLETTETTAPVFNKGDVAVSQFEIPLAAVAAFFQAARAGGATTILNPSPAIEFSRELHDLADIVILNETELGLLAGVELGELGDDGRFIDAARLLQTTKAKTICITLGKRGVIALVDGKPLIIPGQQVEAVDTTGAGDCFVGAVAAQLAAGSSIDAALDYANAAASICVQRMGAAPSMPTAAEVAANRRFTPAPPSNRS
jgi:ribokinase